jgi:hypothetical protein
VIRSRGEEDSTTMKQRKHTPEQIIRKLTEGERLLGEGRTSDSSHLPAVAFASQSRYWMYRYIQDVSCKLR